MNKNLFTKIYWQIVIYIMTTLSVIGLLYGVARLVWYGMTHVSADFARAWALVTTLLFPVAIVLTWLIASQDKRTWLTAWKGATEQVNETVSSALTAKVDTAHSLRQQTNYIEQMPVAILPDVVVPDYLTGNVIDV